MPRSFGLEPHLEVIAWVALTRVSPDGGRIEVIPGSHRPG